MTTTTAGATTTTEVTKTVKTAYSPNTRKKRKHQSGVQARERAKEALARCNNEEPFDPIKIDDVLDSVFFVGETVFRNRNRVEAEIRAQATRATNICRRRPVAKYQGRRCTGGCGSWVQTPCWASRGGRHASCWRDGGDRRLAEGRSKHGHEDGRVLRHVLFPRVRVHVHGAWVWPHQAHGDCGWSPDLVNGGDSAEVRCLHSDPLW